MANDLAEVKAGNVPAWMKAASTGAKIGNIDSSDLKPPRLKILAGQSPEVMDGVPGAQVGQFWMTIVNKNLGPDVVGSLITLKKSYHIWAPLGSMPDQKGPLASTLPDGVHWDVPDQKWVINFTREQGGGSAIWKIGKRVTDFKTHKFGSQRPSDPKSKPIATLTYDMLWVIDMPDGKKKLCLFTAARTGVTPTQNFVSQAEDMGVDHFYQRYRIVSVKKTNNQTMTPYFTYEYRFEGLIESKEDGESLRAIYDKYASSFATSVEAEAEEINESRHEARTGPVVDYSRNGEDRGDDDIPF